jgi:hypothetical protein
LLFKQEESNMKDANRIKTVIGTVMAFALLAIPATLARSQAAVSGPDHKSATSRLIFSVKGPDLFRAYCASCHGIDGRGDGPIAPILRTPPSDLTTIAKRNRGVFPSKRLEIIIAADDLIAAHGNREMPIWGPIFHQVEWDQDLGEVRLQNLIKYVESIQKR